MPIIHTLNNLDSIFPEGAHCPLDRNNGAKSRENPLVICISHSGLCLYKTDTNSHNDVMTVWNPELKCPERIECISLPGLASLPDAIPEVKAQYEAWQRQKTRAATVANLWHKRRQDSSLAKEMRLNDYHALRRLRSSLTEEQFRRATSLLKVKTYKNTQRSTLAGMLRAWANNPKPKFPMPLSPSQLKTL